MDSYSLAHVNHGLEGLLAVAPVSQEDTGRAMHRQQISIGSQRVLFQWVLSGIRALLSIVVLHEGDGIAAIASVADIAVDQRPVAVVLLTQLAPVTTVSSVAHRVAELEVEGCTGLTSTLNPILNGVGTVPALTNRELWLCVFIIHLSI